ncbi:hypothetical protein EIP91_007125 [Steccherinum ochraceum]|uniref:Uncharacterized protein n=1 Tax=Steccherinum ochraceum TaxID=92696 RepID=A0A4V2MVG4_9APHY|nr:hypothetical protein EIP91_007125 [Steccherinum ochraceum]
MFGLRKRKSKAEEVDELEDGEIVGTSGADDESVDESRPPSFAGSENIEDVSESERAMAEEHKKHYLESVTSFTELRNTSFCLRDVTDRVLAKGQTEEEGPNGLGEVGSNPALDELERNLNPNIAHGFDNLMKDIFKWSQSFVRSIAPRKRHFNKTSLKVKKARLSASLSGHSSPLARSPSGSSPYLNVPTRSSSLSVGSIPGSPASSAGSASSHDNMNRSPYLFPPGSSSLLSVASDSSLPLAPHSLSRQVSNSSLRSVGSSVYPASDGSASDIRAVFSGTSRTRGAQEPGLSGGVRLSAAVGSVHPSSSKAGASPLPSSKSGTAASYTPPPPPVSGHVMLGVPPPVSSAPKQPKKTRDGQRHRSESSLRGRAEHQDKKHTERKKLAAEIKADPSKRSFDIFRKNSSPKHRSSLYRTMKRIRTLIKTKLLGHQSTSFANQPTGELGVVKGVKGEEAGESILGAPPDDEEVQKLLKKDYTYVCTSNTSPAVCLTDAEGVIYAVRVRRPRGDKYMPNIAQMYEEAGKVWAKLKKDLTSKKAYWASHQRGNFWCISCGISHSRAEQPEELKFVHPEAHEEALRTFAASEPVQALVQHIVVCFEEWFPHLARVYSVAQRRLVAHDSIFNSFFKDCPFAAWSLNLPEAPLNAVLADEHLDSRDLVFGICAILALGKFDPHHSAQLVLVEPRVIIELGPGDLFLFPSATIRHYSLKMASAEEERKSFIMYSAGSLFRWIRNNHMVQRERERVEHNLPAKGPKIKLTKKETEAVAEEGAARWKAGWNLYTKIDEWKHTDRM